jgi:hypothetical protein
MLNADNAAGFFSRIRSPAFVKEDILTEGNGEYSRDEWSLTRSLGYRNAGPDSSDLDNDGKYLARIFQTQYRNMLSAQRLCNLYDFGRLQSCLEIGCGEMVQAFVISRLFPHLRYKATDFDPYVIEKCSRLELLSGIEKGTVDVAELCAGDLRGFQLVLSWELIYALDEHKLARLFGAVGEAGIPMIAGTTQLTGPLRLAIRYFKGIPANGDYSKEEGCSGGLRRHGWHHSLGYLDGLSRRSGLRLERVWYPPLRGNTLDDFTYLLFSPE